MAIEIAYFFEHPERFPLEGFLDWLTYPHEILIKAKTALNDLLVTPDVRENFGELKSDDVHFYGNYHIGEGTVIYNGVTIIGPVYIGKNCELMPGATVRPYSIIGDNCNVGHGSEVKHTVMYSGAKVASLAFVGDSVLGASARIGSGVITANRKFNQSRVTIKENGERVDLGDSYFGLVLGDSSRLGANSVAQPGTHIGPHTWVFPMTNVRGFLPREKRVHPKVELEFEDNEIIELKP
jgi:bifunctional UDP-N-acetylglucosamine pyrophosphorylase/glucosamine-1-phosphate N-acetyltransferase